MTTTDGEARQETAKANDLFYWPPGLNVRVDQDADVVMFSPLNQHTLLINHMIDKVKGLSGRWRQADRPEH